MGIAEQDRQREGERETKHLSHRRCRAEQNYSMLIMMGSIIQLLVDSGQKAGKEGEREAIGVKWN